MNSQGSECDDVRLLSDINVPAKLLEGLNTEHEQTQSDKNEKNIQCDNQDLFLILDLICPGFTRLQTESTLPFLTVTITQTVHFKVLIHVCS